MIDKNRVISTLLQIVYPASTISVQDLSKMTIFYLFLEPQSRGGLEEFAIIMQTLDVGQS